MLGFYLLPIAAIMPVLWIGALQLFPDNFMLVSGVAFIVQFIVMFIAVKIVVRKSTADPL